MAQDLEISRIVAPEDIRPGQYIAPLQIISERVCEAWERNEPDAADRLVRILRLPDCEPTPVQVAEVCLPFLLVQTVERRHAVLDVRRYRLARLSEQFGRRVFQQAAAERREEAK